MSAFLLYNRVILGICVCVMLFWNGNEFYSSYTILHLVLKYTALSVCKLKKSTRNSDTRQTEKERKKKHWNFFSDLQGFAAIIVKCYQMSRGGGYLILELCFA